MAQQEITVNVDEKILALLEVTTKLSSQMDGLEKNVDKMNVRLNELEHLTKNDATQDLRITNIQESLRRGVEKFDKLSKRDDALEEEINQLKEAEGKRAKETIQRVAQYVLMAIVGAVLSSIPVWLNKIGG